MHNFCPKPENVDDDKLRLSSLDEELRKLAIHYTINTISTAGELGAKAVVLHPGEVGELRHYQDILMDLYREGKMESREFAVIKKKLEEHRNRKKQEYVEGRWIQPLGRIVRGIEYLKSMGIV
ncbi:hypothetical protein ES703_80172 [subsurface metagenome]